MFEQGEDKNAVILMLVRSCLNIDKEKKTTNPSNWRHYVCTSSNGEQLKEKTAASVLFLCYFVK